MADKEKSQEFGTFFASGHDEQGLLIALTITNDYNEALNWIEREKKEKEKNPEALDQLQELTLAEDEDKEEDKELEQSFSTTLENLVSSISSFYHSISVTHFMRPALIKVYVEKQIKEYRDEHMQLIDELDNFSVHGVPVDHVSAIIRRSNDLSQLQDGLIALRANILMGLVASFDSQISGLIKFILMKKPEMLKGGEKSIDVKEVLSFQNFEDLISELVDRQIYDLMRGSHFEQVKYIERNFNIDVSDGFERWPRFLEVFERRNLAAHGEGVANARYLQKCKEYKVSDDDILELGNELSLTARYLRRSTDVLLEFGILLIWWIWLKHAKDEVNEAYSTIRDVTYDLIVEKRFRLASNILESALSRVDKNAPEEVQRMMAVNLANCYKKLDLHAECVEALKKFNWTASADNYKICVAALEEDLEVVCQLMSKVKDPDLIGKQGFREWPVFDWIREETEFNKTFEQVFGEPLKAESNITEELDEDEPE